jgi:hypothetical protein
MNAMADLVPWKPTGSGVFPTKGVTGAERYLAKLCKRSFLSLWSYPRVFRNQGRPQGKGDGKELCDLLVVFDNHIIIFSDKDCRFNDVGDLDLAWSRWFKKTVQKSAEQVWGAERWIKNFPNRLFLDSQCLIPFPIDLPDPAKAIFHRIVVAHDVSRVCRERLGGSGSLVLDSSLSGEAHVNMPFTIGQIDPEKGYVHVFDDTTLNIVMSTLDTITDFAAYLTKKERFLTGDRVVHAAGEEELLAAYLLKRNESNEHDFIIDGHDDVLSFPEGLWESFVRSPHRQAQIESDRISYSWDKLIEEFALHAMTGTHHFSSGEPLNELERVFRCLAREPRTRRRLLATSFHEIRERSMTSSGAWDACVMQPTNPGYPHYVFMLLKGKEGLTDEEYRKIRTNLLRGYCGVTKLRFPKATDIIGIASEAGFPLQPSADFTYLDASHWSMADEASARKIQNRFGLLRKVTADYTRVYEYPLDHVDKPSSTKLPRNSPCPCGSGERYKRCHGKELLGKNRK